MRLKVPGPVRFDGMRGSSALFWGAAGERFQVTVLEDWLFRVEHWPEGKARLDRTWTILGTVREDDEGGPADCDAPAWERRDLPPEGRRRDDLSVFNRPPFTVEQSEGRVALRTPSLSITVHSGDPRLVWSDGAGKPFAADLAGRAYAYDAAGTAVYHYLERRPDEHYFGFGERSGPLDKRGRRMRMENMDALGYDARSTDPLYKHWPFYITWIPDHGIAYGLFYDNLSTTCFDMGKEVDAYHGDYRYYRAENGDVDFYFIYGPSLEQVVERFSLLIGRMSMPPRWSLGYLGSGMAYVEAIDAERKLSRFIELCREHRIPCDMFHLSSGYAMSASGHRHVFQWNRSKVPDPAALARRFHASGLKLVANLKPCLLTTHPDYSEVAGRDGFVRSAERDGPEVSAFWGGSGSYIDFTSPAAYRWWKDQVRTQLLEAGIDGTWNDNNEYEIWDDEARCTGFGKPLPIGQVRPLQALLMTRASCEAQREAAPDRRAFLITRSGCPGIQRYAQTWSGDNSTSWESLRYNIPMGLGFGLSGMPNTGHDVGGFFGPAPEPELFVRWVQNGVFHPRFSIHSWRLDSTANEPWMYEEVLPIVREAIELRYRLIPYLYTLFAEAARTGHPIVRPLAYHYPEDPRVRTESFDFLLGRHLLVASVLENGARTRSVYLPRGARWCDFWTGRWYEGGDVADLPAPLDRAPLAVAEGGIIPTGLPVPASDRRAANLRQVYVFPPAGPAEHSFCLVEDDGESLGYLRGDFTEVALKMFSRPDRIRLEAKVTCSGYAIAYREVEYLLPPGETRPVEAPGGREAGKDASGRRRVKAPLLFSSIY